MKELIAKYPAVFDEVFLVDHTAPKRSEINDYIFTKSVTDGFTFGKQLKFVEKKAVFDYIKKNLPLLDTARTKMTLFSEYDPLAHDYFITLGAYDPFDGLLTQTPKNNTIYCYELAIPAGTPIMTHSTARKKIHFLLGGKKHWLVLAEKTIMMKNNTLLPSNWESVEPIKIILTKLKYRR